MAEKVYRFKEDPVNKLVRDILSKKPVNSEHFTTAKRMKPGDQFRKNGSRPTREELETVEERSRQLLKDIGFSYGRLQQKHNTNRKATATHKIRAPGPLDTALYKGLHEHDTSSEENATTGKKGFTPVFCHKGSAAHRKQASPKSKRPSKSQSGAKRLLIQEQLRQMNGKREKAVTDYNGSFWTNTGKTCANMKLTIKLRSFPAAGEDHAVKRADLLRQVEGAIAKNVVRTHQSDLKKSSKHKDIDRTIAHTVRALMDKCRPANVPAFSLTNSSIY